VTSEELLEFVARTTSASGVSLQVDDPSIARTVAELLDVDEQEARLARAS